MLEWNQARGITSVLVAVGRGEVPEDGCGVTEGVLAATDVSVAAVQKERSSSAGEDEEVLPSWVRGGG